MTVKIKLNNTASDSKVASKVAMECLKVFLNDNSNIGTSIYLAEKRACDRHRANTLKSLHGQVVECSGTLARRGEGTRGNLNIVLTACINGVYVDHIQVYDELVEEYSAKVGDLFKFTAKVYGYRRKNGTIGYGVKPTWMPLDTRRGEF